MLTASLLTFVKISYATPAAQPKTSSPRSLGSSPLSTFITTTTSAARVDEIFSVELDFLVGGALVREEKVKEGWIEKVEVETFDRVGFGLPVYLSGARWTFHTFDCIGKRKGGVVRVRRRGCKGKADYADLPGTTLLVPEEEDGGEEVGGMLSEAMSEEIDRKYASDEFGDVLLSFEDAFQVEDEGGYAQ